MSGGFVVLLIIVGAVFLVMRGLKGSAAAGQNRGGGQQAPAEPPGIKPSFTHSWDLGGRSWGNPVAAMSRESGLFPTTAGGLDTLIELEAWINTKDPRAPGQILACLRGNDPGVCHYVAMWCANLGMTECEPALVEILGRRERIWGYARKQSALSLARLGCSGAIDALRAARMSEESEGVAESMTEAIRELERIPTNAS